MLLFFTCGVTSVVFHEFISVSVEWVGNVHVWGECNISRSSVCHEEQVEVHVDRGWRIRSACLDDEVVLKEIIQIILLFLMSNIILSLQKN